MTTEAKERMRELDREYKARERTRDAAKRRYELALADLMQAEHALGAIWQKRTAWEGMNL